MFSTLTSTLLSAREVPGAEPQKYLLSDMKNCVALSAKLQKEIDEAKLGRGFGFEMNIVPVLARMETRGVEINTKILKDVEGSIQARIRSIEAEASRMIGYTVLLSSSKQVAEVIYDKLKIEPVATEKNKRSTAEQVLQQIQKVSKHPFPGLVLLHRKTQKLLTGFVTPFIEFSDRNCTKHGEAVTIHCQWNHTGTGTGRLSCSKPVC